MWNNEMEKVEYTKRVIGPKTEQNIIHDLHLMVILYL